MSMEFSPGTVYVDERTASFYHRSSLVSRAADTSTRLILAPPGK